MAMVVKNNMSAVNTLNTLNKNQSALSKSLAKVSSGMKINSAQDDASGYAISERMRVMIRSLDQANQNTQNGSSLMKVAEGAVSNTVEILKTLKEKAINAATDTNTDEDRAIIQKEIDQLVDQIDDNALITFNGKYLLDGSKVQSGQATYATFTNQMLAVGTTGSSKLTALSNRNNEELGILSTDKITASYVRNGETFVTTFDVGDKSLSSIFAALEAEEDTKIFAGSSNKSVVAAVNGSTDAVSVVGEDAADDPFNFGYTKEELLTKQTELANTLNSAYAGSVAEALDRATGAIGTVGVDATNKCVSVAAADTSGAAGNLALALEELVKANYSYTVKDDNGADCVLYAYSTNTNETTDGTGDDALGIKTFWGETINGKNGAAADAAPSVANATDIAKLLQDGTKITGDQYKAIETAVDRLKTIAKAQPAAGDLATKLKTAVDAYNAAIDTKTAAQKEYDEKYAAKVVVDQALATIETKEAVDALKPAFETEILKVLQGLTHSEDVAAADIQLKNNSYVGVYEFTYTSGLVSAVGTDYEELDQQYDSDDGSINTIATQLADKLIERLDDYVEHLPSSSPLTSRQLLTTLISKLGVGATGSVAAIDWSKTDTNIRIDTDGNGVLDANLQTFQTNDGTTTAKSTDIKGIGKAYEAYSEAYQVTSSAANAAEFSGKLKDAMGTAGDTSIAIINSKNIGLNTAGAMVTTADGSEGLTITSNIAGLKGQISGITISVADAQGNVRKSVNTALSAWDVTIFASNEAEVDNSLKFHIGAQANQSIAVDIKDMRAAALGLKGDNGKVVSVATQSKANAAVNVFENALRKALDMQTTIGAIEARLEYTASNLTTSTENVQAAESTIRDADMAKEMTNYTKNNVLLQAAQSMLAQANQNSSAVLSLLQ